MREQQVHPPLAAALPVILEHHKGSLQGDVPSTAQRETVTCGMCLSTQGCTQISGSNKTTLLFSHCPAPHSGLWHLTPILPGHGASGSIPQVLLLLNKGLSPWGPSHGNPALLSVMLEHRHAQGICGRSTSSLG